MTRELQKKFKGDIDLFLKPGEILYSEKPMIVKTILGSCISIVFYHPPTQSGSISHALLPTDHSDLAGCENCVLKCKRGKSDDSFRFVTCAILHMFEKFTSRSISPSEIEVKLFGGANVLKNVTANIGKQNILKAHEILSNLKLEIAKEDTGGNVSRVVRFDTSSGEVIIKRAPTQH